MGKNETARYEGARWALDKINEIGLDAAKEEFKWRGIYSVPLKVEKADVDAFVRQYASSIKRSMCAMTCLVLHDEFGFGQKRVEQFIARWNMKCDGLLGGFADWEDYADVLKEEVGVDIDLPQEYFKLRAKDFVEIKRQESMYAEERKRKAREDELADIRKQIEEAGE